MASTKPDAGTLAPLATLGLACMCAWASSADAKLYVDTKKRFSLETAAGWRLAPRPGDTLGMVFVKEIDGVPASLSVVVRPIEAGLTVADTLRAAEAPFRDEIGFSPGADTPAAVGGLSSVRRTLSVTASGDAKTRRAVELTALHAYGFSHVIHFETLEKNKAAFARDVDRMLESYQALAGRSAYGPLVGRWTNQAGGPDLHLNEDGGFSLAAMKGDWRMDGGELCLRVREGEEKYRYTVDARRLVLTSPNLQAPLEYIRTGGKLIDDGQVERAGGPLLREHLLGTWKVVDLAATDRLVLFLSASGSVSFGGLAGRWRYSTGRLTITSTAGHTITYSASMTDGKLVLGGGDLDREITLERE